MHEHILIVEDDAKIASVVRDYLAADGYRASLIARGDAVEAAVRAGDVDLVLLDLMLPGLGGLEVCKRLRTFSTVPVVMLTARVEEIDRLLGLELGADDYICKPFSPREVVARVRAILRRAGRTGGTAATASPLQLDEAGYRAHANGQDLELTAVEFHLLRVLVAHPGRVYSRAQLIDGMYADFRVVSERTVDSHIKKLRQKIALRLPGVELIRSVYGAGYKFEP